MIKIIFFDVGGVLASGNFESERASKSLRVNKREFDAIIVRFSGPCEEAKISDNDFLKRFSDKFDLSFSNVKNIWTKAYEKNLKVNKYMYRLVFALKKLGYKIGIISNVKKIYTTINNKKKVYSGFSPVVLSYKVKIIKPNKKIYLLSCRLAKVKPSEAVFIDDRIKNVRGARVFGMKAILYKNPAKLKKDLRRLGLNF